MTEPERTTQPTSAQISKARRSSRRSHPPVGRGRELTRLDMGIALVIALPPRQPVKDIPQR
jgi:hypothetical protein